MEIAGRIEIANTIANLLTRERTRANVWSKKTEQRGEQVRVYLEETLTRKEQGHIIVAEDGTLVLVRIGDTVRGILRNAGYRWLGCLH